MAFGYLVRYLNFEPTEVVLALVSQKPIQLHHQGLKSPLIVDSFIPFLMIFFYYSDA